MAWLYSFKGYCKKKAYKEGLRIGGKTGTAQKAQSGVGYIEGNYYSLFVGFYPVVNPKYTALVIIDNPKDEFYGGEVAAPVVTNIFFIVTLSQVRVIILKIVNYILKILCLI